MINPKKILYFDIETTTNYENWQKFVKNDKIGSDAFKLKYDRANNNNKWSGNIEDVYLKMGTFFPEYGKIICISYGVFKGDEFKTSTKSIKESNEENLLKYISKIFQKTQDLNFYLSGHNIKNFDIPFIFKKLLKYNIKIPNIINFINKKPWEYQLLDTSDLTKSSNYIPSSLSDITYLLNLKPSKDDISGSDVFNVFWKDKDIDRICKYCEKDVITVKDIYLKLYNLL